MIAGDGADRAAYVDDFGGSEAGGKRGDHATPRHGNLHVAKIQEGMSEEVPVVATNGGNGARGVDGSIALYETHARHIACGEMLIVRRCGRGSALRGDEPIGL